MVPFPLVPLVPLVAPVAAPVVIPLVIPLRVPLVPLVPPLSRHSASFVAPFVIVLFAILLDTEYLLLVPFPRVVLHFDTEYLVPLRVLLVPPLPGVVVPFEGRLKRRENLVPFPSDFGDYSRQLG